MKKLKVKKGSTCMACLACVQACSEAFYKEFDPDKACLQIVEKKAVRPIACPQCGKCADAGGGGSGYSSTGDAILYCTAGRYTSKHQLPGVWNV